MELNTHRVSRTRAGTNPYSKDRRPKKKRKTNRDTSNARNSGNSFLTNSDMKIQSPKPKGYRNLDKSTSNLVEKKKKKKHNRKNPRAFPFEMR